MSSSEYRRTSNPGYRLWFKPYEYKERVTESIFILDFETSSRREEEEISFSDSDEYTGKRTRSRTINGIQIYFIDKQKNKRTSFLRHNPYFYLLLKEGLERNETNRIMAQIQGLLL